MVCHVSCLCALGWCSSVTVWGTACLLEQLLWQIHLCQSFLVLLPSFIVVMSLEDGAMEREPRFSVFRWAWVSVVFTQGDWPTVEMQIQQWVIGMMGKFTHNSMSTHFITSSLLLLISKAEDSIWNRHPKWRVGVESSSKGDANHFLRLYKSYSKMLFLKGRVEERGSEEKGERERDREGEREERRRKRQKERESLLLSFWTQPTLLIFQLCFCVKAKVAMVESYLSCHLLQ